SGSRIIVDRVVRYENLTDEIGEIFARLNIPFDGDLGVRKKAHFRTDRRPYQLVSSPQQRQIVERVFAREIQLHAYRFAQTPNLEAMVIAGFPPAMLDGGGFSLLVKVSGLWN